MSLALALLALQVVLVYVALRLAHLDGYRAGIEEGRRRQIADSRARRDASFGWVTDDGVITWADPDGVEQVVS